MRAAVFGPPRMLADPSMHALVLLRVVGAAPAPLRGAAQRLLLWSHGIYVDPTAEVGPGLSIPHPIAITLGPGVRIGAGVALYHNVTIRASGHSPAPAPQIGDGARVYTGAVVCGPITLGARATVGAGTVVRHDVEPGERIVRRQGAPDGGDAALALWVREQPGTVEPRRGLRELLAADHRLRFGAENGAGEYRIVLDGLRDRALRVTTIIRLQHAGPPALRRLWRRLLLLHGCDIGFDATIGGGLSVPCPIGVCVGRRAVLGTGVELSEHTTVTPTRTSWQETPTTPRFRIGDGTLVLPGAAALGEIAIASGVVIAPWALVTREDGNPARASQVDGDDGVVECLANATSVNACGRRGAAAAPAAAADDDPPPVEERARRPGLLALMRSDLDRLASAGGTTRVSAAFGLPFSATVLMRLATCRRPRPVRIGRLALRGLYHCYVDEHVRVGPGLLLPFPCGIRLERGVRLGADVTVHDRVSLRSGLSVGGRDAAPTVADGTVLGTGAVVIGGREVVGVIDDGAVLVGR